MTVASFPCERWKASDAVRVSDHERLIVEPATQAPQSSAGHGAEAGIDHRYAPVDLRGRTKRHLAIADADREVVRHEVKILEKAFDGHRLVPAGDDEVAVAPMIVDIHDVEHDGPAGNFDHRLGYADRLLGES